MTVHHCSVGTVSDLSSCTELRQIDLSDNQIAFVGEVAFPDGVESLNLNGNKLHRLGGLAGLGSALRELQLSGNALTDIAGIGEVAGLQKLELNYNKLEDGQLQYL